MDVNTTKSWEDVSLCRSVSSISSARSSAEATAGNDVSSFIFDDFRDDASSITKSHCRYWLCVGHLSQGTTDTELKALFYPYGADEAFISWEGPVMSGYVGFDSTEMAALAAQKMHFFIPRRQSQALVVQPTTLDEVAHARTRVPRSLIGVLYSEASSQSVSAVILHARSPAVMAAEVATEVARASPMVLQRIVATLAELLPTWPSFAAFNEALLKVLLRSLLEASDMNPAQSTNCGTVVGQLFVLAMITGDPFYLATRLLQRGSQRLAQLEGVCALAHTCAALTDFHISRAAFWAQVAEITTQVNDAETTRALLIHLRRYTKAASPAASATPFAGQSVQAARTPTFSTMPCRRSAMVQEAPRPFVPHPRQDEMKRRTLYVSHLPGLLPQSMLLELLEAAGAVNKVRICAGTGYNTLFAFVEMRTIEGAERAMCMNGLQLMDFAIRVQTARNAVQDVVREDAEFAADGSLLHPCLFGSSAAPLSQCLASTN